MKYRLKQDIKFPGRNVAAGTLGTRYPPFPGVVPTYYYEFKEFVFKEEAMKEMPDWFELVP